MPVTEKTEGYSTCIVCGKVRTKDPSGLCSRCKEKADSAFALCKVCGVRKTSHPSGVCAKCRRERTSETIEKMDVGVKAEYIDLLITNLQDDIRLLTYYQEGKSFEEIASAMDRTKNSVYQAFQRLVGAKAFGELADRK